MVSMRVLAVFSSLSLDQILFAGQCVSSSKLAFWMFCDGNVLALLIGRLSLV